MAVLTAVLIGFGVALLVLIVSELLDGDTRPVHHYSKTPAAGPVRFKAGPNHMSERAFYSARGKRWIVENKDGERIVTRGPACLPMRGEYVELISVSDHEAELEQKCDELAQAERELERLREGLREIERIDVGPHPESRLETNSWVAERVRSLLASSTPKGEN